MLQPHNLRLPLIAAPMFLVSGPELVIACCKAGVIGTFPALNHRTSEGFAEWLTTIKSALHGMDHPGFGVNLIVHKTNPRWEADLAICIEHKVPLIITSLGAVPALVDQVHAYGGQVFHDVINVRHAKKAAAAGVDGLIAVSAGAGGHAGTLHPFALLREIREWFDGTLVLSGSLSTGQDIAAAQAAGADYAYLGTRFICTEESAAVPAYKQMIESSTASDIVYTDKVSGVPANFLKPSLSPEAADPSSADSKKPIDFGKELTAPDEGSKAWKDVWSAGHGVGGIQESPTVAALVDELHRDFDATLDRLSESRFRTR